MNNTMMVSGPKSGSSSSITNQRSRSDQPDAATAAGDGKQSSSGVTKAINSARRSFRNVNRSLRNSSRKIARRGKVRKAGSGGSKSGSLRSAGSVEAVRELWSKTGMRTNGRKLLIEPSKSDNDFVNDAFENDDNSQVSVPRERENRNFPKERQRQETRRQTSSSSSSSEDVAWTRHKIARAKQDTENADQIHVDKIENLDRNIANNPSKH